MNDRLSAAAVDAQSPWPGLASFQEGDRDFFRGRERETEAVLRLARRARLTVLFGLSGLGKTSLLNAGVFPALRDENVMPVPIRLAFGTGARPLAEQVKQAVANASRSAGVEVPAPRDGETLWETFHRRGAEFWNENHQLVQPLLVFDQFEEIFTLGRSNPAQTEVSAAFLDELADLIEGSPPDSVKTRLEQNPKSAREFSFGRHAYRILLSLREDFLPHLEELRDRIASLAHNRFRLRPMNGAAALRVAGQNPQLVAPEVAERIVRFVAAADPAATDAPLESLQVEPALLSVVCRELNGKRLAADQQRITADLLEGSREEIVSGIYERSLEGLPAELRAFVEDRLLTVSGYRDSVAWDNALETPGVAEDGLRELVKRRLLRIEDAGRGQRIELTHDLLTGVVAASRNRRHVAEEIEDRARERDLAAEKRREEEENQRRLRLARQSRVAAAVLAVLAVLAVVMAWQAKSAKREAERQRLAAISALEVAKSAQLEAEEQRQAAVSALKEAKKHREIARAVQTLTRVHFNDLRGSARLRAIYTELSDFQHIVVVGEEKDSDLVVSDVDGFIDVRLVNQAEVSQSPQGSRERGTDAGVDAITRWAKWLALRRLTYEDPDISIELMAGPVGSTRTRRDHRRTVRLFDGERFEITCTNHYEKDLYLIVIHLTEQGQIQQIFPSRGKEEFIAPGTTWSVEVPASVAKRRTSVRDHLKLFATTEPSSFGFLFGQTEYTRGSRLSGPRNDFEELISTVALGTTPDNQVEDVEGWTTSEVVLVTVRRGSG